MIDFLNACIFCFGVSGVIGLIIGHEDGPMLALLAIAALSWRLVPVMPVIADWARGRGRR